jgi:hypothetical protein
MKKVVRSAFARITSAAKMTSLWDVALCSLVEVDGRFRGETTGCYIPESCNLHPRRRENLKSHNSSSVTPNISQGRETHYCEL